jgi:hypothetical protein
VVVGYTSELSWQSGEVIARRSKIVEHALT